MYREDVWCLGISRGHDYSLEAVQRRPMLLESNTQSGFGLMLQIVRGLRTL